MCYLSNQGDILLNPGRAVVIPTTGCDRQLLGLKEALSQLYNGCIILDSHPTQLTKKFVIVFVRFYSWNIL